MFTVLTAAVTLGDKLDSAFYGFDMWIYSLFGAIQCDVLTFLAKLFTSLGDPMFVIPFAAIGLVMCFFKKTRKYGGAIVIAVALGTLCTNLVLKPMFLRVRPYNTLQNVPEYWAWYVKAGMLSESDYCFPSGHTTAAFEIAAALYCTLKSDGKKKLVWTLPVLAVLVMCSRIYLMVHYPTDVIGGAIAGTAAGVLGYVFSVLICNFMMKRKKLDNIDLQPLVEKTIHKKLTKRTVSAVLACATCALLIFAFVTLLGEGGEDALRCAYDGEYDCQNEAKTSSDYPPIDGEYYCKIHYKQLTEETGETATLDKAG